MKDTLHAMSFIGMQKYAFTLYQNSLRKFTHCKEKPKLHAFFTKPLQMWSLSSMKHQYSSRKVIPDIHAFFTKTFQR